jgi:glycosyltransferase involved in cell wall biosynthesis
MIRAVVIPAKNEADQIGKVLSNITYWAPDFTVVVANGCQDATIDVAMALGPMETHIIDFKEPLGIDVPRAIGAKYAYELGAEAVVFIDGDMSGNLAPVVLKLLAGIQNEVDLALTNCYPYITRRLSLTEKMLNFRKLLNQELGLYNTLGTASPCHGPHAVSRRLLEKIGFTSLAIPPLELAMARKKDCDIKVQAAISHIHLNSKTRPNAHSRLVTETIIGDCIEAIRYYRGQDRNRIWDGIEYDGYNSQRHWDLLEAALINISCLKTIRR